MDGRGKNGEKLPISCYLRSSLTAQSVTPRRGWGSGAAGGSGGAACAPPPGCAAGQSERLVHTLWTCKLVVLEFHDEEASPPFPPLFAACCFAVVLAHLPHQTCARPARPLSPTLSLRPLCFYIISHFALCSPQDVRGSHLRSSCQVLIPASVPDIIQTL